MDMKSTGLNSLNHPQRKLLDMLAATGRRTRSGELATMMGVTTRSIRNYVQQIRARLGTTLIDAGTDGYLLNLMEYDTLLHARGGHSTAQRPDQRVAEIISILINSTRGVDLFDLASQLHVSEATIEADLRRARATMKKFDLALLRAGSRLTVNGGEQSKRQIISQLIRDSSTQGFLDLDTIETQFGLSGLHDFKSDVIGMLDSFGFFVNEYTINSVMLHIVIAVGRSQDNHRINADFTDAPLPTDASARLRLPLQHLVQRHFDVTLDDTDVAILASMLATRVIAPKSDTTGVSTTDLQSLISPEVRALVRQALLDVKGQFLLDLDDADLINRLTLHYSGLIRRAASNSYNENPLTQSIKHSYPLVYEVAVFIVSQLQAHHELAITDDEIAYVAMHVGAFLERESHRAARISAALVAPTYYDLPERLRHRIEDAFPDELSIDVVITRTDVNWDEIDTDLIITTIEGLGRSDQFVLIPPFLDDAGIERIRHAIVTVRQARQREQLRQQLQQYARPSWFQRDLQPGTVATYIAHLGAPLLADGVISQAYLDDALRREQMSSTTFGGLIAVPHALTERSERNALSIAVNSSPIPWGNEQVSVAVLVAFGTEQRAEFQNIFEQLVEVFANPASIQALVKHAHDFESFLDTVTALA